MGPKPICFTNMMHCDCPRCQFYQLEQSANRRETKQALRYMYVTTELYFICTTWLGMTNLFYQTWTYVIQNAESMYSGLEPGDFRMPTPVTLQHLLQNE